MTASKEGQLDRINQPILEALHDLRVLDEKNISYLVVGSLICAAAKGRYYRQINDADLICELKDEERIKEIFGKIGYAASYQRPKRHLGFYWLDLIDKKDKRKVISIIFGSFDNKGGWRLALDLGFSLYLPALAVQPTKYCLKGIDFAGFPLESVYISLTTFPLIYDNPKRKGDLESLKGKVDTKLVDKIYDEKAGFWFLNFCLPNRALLKALTLINKFKTS